MNSSGSTDGGSIAIALLFDVSTSRAMPSIVAPRPSGDWRRCMSPAAESACSMVSVTPFIGPERVSSPADASARLIVSVMPLTSNLAAVRPAIPSWFFIASFNEKEQ